MLKHGFIGATTLSLARSLAFRGLVHGVPAGTKVKLGEEEEKLGQYIVCSCLLHTLSTILWQPWEDTFRLGLAAWVVKVTKKAP